MDTSYTAQTAYHLDADLINLGIAGSAFCEPEMANYIATRNDWHIATLSISVNMVSNFSVEQFYERATYMINTVCGSNTARPVVCITLFPFYGDISISGPMVDDFKGPPEEYRKALRTAVKACPYPNIYLIEGSDIFHNIKGLTADLIHPSDSGHIEIGHNLSQKLKPLVTMYYPNLPLRGNNE